ncbi:translocation/assembly module TamB [Deinococcus koreensis]|uniref:Translocation/assembly module TamB n=1 Tax=Deinococcus koreensis TaxID=2054903 RepID=A0A2K3V1Y0_9DEIO|nr:translocation/assembly module TamB [Deinococcus koreensis]
MLGLLAVVLLGLALLPTVLGGVLLRQLGGPAGISAQSVGGPLWAPHLGGAVIRLPGVEARADSLDVSVASVNPLTRTLRLNVRARGAAVNLKLRDLVSGTGGAAGGGGGWKVVLSGLDVQDTRVNVDGKGINVPDGRFRVQPGRGGALDVRGRTADGDLNAAVRVSEGAAGNVFTVDLDSDARVLRHYWKGVTAGRITGRYVLNDGPIRGDLKLSGGALRVPEAMFVTVTGLSGAATHRGDDIGLRLAGTGWDGPVTAQGGVDLKAQNWTLTADATPTVGALAKALGSSGRGGLKLRVTAGGWSTVRVKAYAQGAGTVAGVQFSDANAEYTFLSENGATATQTNDLAFSANTALAGAAQRLEGRWAFGRAGRASLVGAFGQKPLDIQATIDAANRLSFSGQGLGGPLRGTFALGGARLDAVLNPTYGAARARVALRGTPSDLRAVLSGGQAGPFALAGTAALDSAGLRADFGTATLNLDRDFRGRWTARNLSGAGLSLDGEGQIDLIGGDVTGRLTARVPGLDAPLSGPLALNYTRQRGTFEPAGQRLSWQGDSFRVNARDLRAAGFRLDGDLTVTTTLKAFGTLRARGGGLNLSATGRGTAASLRGTVGGVTVLADTQLSAPYLTTARVQGSDIRGVLSVDDRVRFTLTTAGDTVRGEVDGQNVTARGRVNLGSLRPLLGTLLGPSVPALAGTLDLDLAGTGGTARLGAVVAGAQVRGTLRRAGGPVTADLTATLAGASARLAGRVYPDVAARGTLSAQGQTLAASLDGSYGDLRARVGGRTGELAFSGVTIPAQTVNLSGSLTPRLAVSGTWGDLNVTYDAATGLARVTGQQALTAFGQEGRIQGRATWGPGAGGPGWRGAVEARGVLDQYTVALSGPWSGLNVLLTDGEGLQARGTAALPEGRYSVNVRGPVAGGPGQGGLYVDGRVAGRGTEPRGRLNVRDGRGGTALIDLRGFTDFDLRARGLTLAGQPLSGDLKARSNILSGRLSAGPLTVTAADGLIRAVGVIAGQSVTASGRLTLPATVSNLNVRVTGPSFTAQASGGVADLRGLVSLRPQAYGSDPARLSVPAQTFPLRASLTGARATVGGLTYQGGRWRGALAAAYALSGRAGRVEVVGTGAGLAALPSGPLAGRLTLLPTLGGTLSSDLAPFRGLLPAALRQEIVPGRLIAQITAGGAALQTQGARYLNEPLGLSARVSWPGVSGEGGLTASGTLTHPGTRLPVRLEGRTLSIDGAVLDARALQPLYAGARGSATLSLSVPDLDFAQASGRARVNIAAQGQRAVGLVSLSRGQLSANLTSTLGGVPVRVVGPLYPQANATLGWEGLRGTLNGSASTALNLSVSGTYQKQAVNVRVVGSGLTGTRTAVRLSGTVAGAALDVALTRGPGTALSAWRTSGVASLSDLRPLTGLPGQLSASLGGTLADVRLAVTGEASGVQFTAPLSYRGGVLRLSGGTATLAQSGLSARLRASGPLYPRLDLSARAAVEDGLPGTYTAQLRGQPGRPDLSVQGVLVNGRSGLQAGGSRVTAHLLGPDWKAEFSGRPLAGPVRGRLGSGALGGLLDTRLTLDTVVLGGDTTVRLRGQTGWNVRRGWSGTLRAVGDIPGGPLDAVLDGAGTLRIAGMIGQLPAQARFTGVLPAALPLRPGGTLTLSALDLAALWGRPNQLRLTGDATLGGASWSALVASFAGQVQDSAGELSGDLGATYRAGDLSLRLAGQRVAGGGTLAAGRYDLTLRADTVRLARLLPPGLDVDALTFAGTVEAHGTLAGGPREVTLRSVALRGEQGQAGPFSLYGSALYTPTQFQTALSGSLRGGVLSAQGALPAGVRVTVRDLSTEYVGAASFGRGTLGADLTLRGDLLNPALEGTADARTAALDAHLTLSGRARDPHALLRLVPRGAASGTLYADLRDLDLSAGRVRAKLYGTLSSGGATAGINLSGVWPRLAGTVRASVPGMTQPLTLSGDGSGAYTLYAGQLGGGTLSLGGGVGFVPALTGALNLNPLPLLPSATGAASVTATLGGTLAAPTLAARVGTRGVAVSGVTLDDLSGTFAGTLSSLSGTLAQRGGTVATLSGRTLALDGVQLGAAGSTVTLSGRASLDGTADVSVAASGPLGGALRATYAARALSVKGNVTGPQSLRADLDVQADPFTGWHGTARVSGGPQGVLTSPAALRLSGPFAFPRLGGEAGLLGAGARILADARGAQLRLVDGPGASASGVVELRPDAGGGWRWLGAASLSRPELSLSVTPSGPLADPQLLLSVRRGEWRAGGTASLRRADLTVSDGEKDGTLSWNEGQLAANLPGLRLARLGLGGLDGLITASGQVSTTTQDGRLALKVAGLSTPYDVPYLGVALDGDLSADVALRGGRPSVQAVATLPAGTLNLSAVQGPPAQGQAGPGPWTGRISGRLSRESGTLDVNVGADRGGLSGAVKLAAFPADVAGQRLVLGGSVDLSGQTFQAKLAATSRVGSASVDASGGVADLLPSLGGVLALRPTEEGYAVRAVLDELEVRDLKIAPGLSGQLSGEANLRDGGGTFVLRSAALNIGPRTLPARLEGTQVSGDWRIRGFLGESEFTAGLNGGQVFGQGSLRALPLGAVVGAVAGTTPGEGVLTGVVRFRFPLADPPSGSATLVAERIRVSATSMVDGRPQTDTLIGSGSLDFADRELRSVNVQLAGAGTWDVRGQYTRSRVDLTAQFTDTTFTPVLQLVPALADMNTSLKGSLTLSAAGTYERPRAAMRAANITGSVAGLSVQVPRFAGDLPDSGAFTAGGDVLTGGTVGTNGRVDIRGQLTLGRLSGTSVAFAGLLAPQALGALPNTTATLKQVTESRWALDVQSRSTTPGTPAAPAATAGTLSLSGDIAPRWNLTLTARNYNLPLGVVYGRDSSLNADLRAVDDGSLIRVTGAADFLRLTLGRVNAPSTIPAPGQTTSTTDGRTTDNYASPLPEVYTSFPRPTQDGQAAPPARPLLDRLVFEDIPIRAPGGIRVDENLVRADFSGGLVLSGSGSRPLLSGEIRSQRGFISLRENEFTLQDSRVTFDGNSLYPRFDITARGSVPASTTNQVVPVTVNLAGQFVARARGDTVLDLKTTLSCTTQGAACSDPATGTAYSEPELYALVATGVPNLTALPGNLGALGSSALQTALNLYVLGEVERTIARAFGLNVFRFTPQISNADGSFGATVTLGSYLTRDLYLQYQVDLSGRGLIDATYNTPDNRFTFRVSTTLNGLDLQSLRPSFSTAYNINPRTSVSIGVENTDKTTRLRFGVSYRLFAR